MAITETTDVGIITDDAYIKCAHIIHWVEDNYDSRCNDTYCMVHLDDDVLRDGIARKHHDADADEIVEKLGKLRDVVDNELDKKNIALADFIASQDGYFHMHCDGESVIGGYEGDEFDCGTYVEAVLEDLEDCYDIPIGTHTCRVIDEFVREEYPTLIDQLPVEYIPVQGD